jgi:hypothetical protein
MSEPTKSSVYLDAQFHARLENIKREYKAETGRRPSTSQVIRRGLGLLARYLRTLGKEEDWTFEKKLIRQYRKAADSSV